MTESMTDKPADNQEQFSESKAKTKTKPKSFKKQILLFVIFLIILGLAFSFTKLYPDLFNLDVTTQENEEVDLSKFISGGKEETADSQKVNTIADTDTDAIVISSEPNMTEAINKQSQLINDLTQQIQQVLQNNKNNLDDLTKSLIEQEATTNELMTLLRQWQHNYEDSQKTTRETQQSIFKKLNTLTVVKGKTSNNVPFELIAVDLWDSQPQATIRSNGKISIVKQGDTRLTWEIVNISFDKEEITIASKDGQTITLEKIQ